MGSNDAILVLIEACQNLARHALPQLRKSLQNALDIQQVLAALAGPPGRIHWGEWSRVTVFQNVAARMAV